MPNTHTDTPMPNAQCHCLFINTNLCSVIKTQNFPGPARARAGAKTVEQSNESDGFIVLLLLCVGVGDLRPFRGVADPRLDSIKYV